MPQRDAHLRHITTPIDMYKLNLQIWHLAVETQVVVTMRVLGMSGIWRTAPSENTRMMAEKPAAFARSAEAAMKAATSGKRADEVLSAAVEPLRRRTSSNAKRLAKNGPRQLLN